MSEAVEFVMNTQEQAVASWVSYLNQLRIDNLLGALRLQDGHLQDALTSVDEAISKIDLEVVAANRGGQRGMHGFIAEIAEVGIGNARKQILGEAPDYQWVNDNGPVDLMRGSVAIQQKFVAAGGRFSLGAITEHLQKYPEYVRNGGKYQIPSDHFEMIQRLRALSPEDASKLSRSGDGPSLRDWQRVQTFFESRSVGIESLEPSTLRYDDVQRDIYTSTMAAEKDSLRATDKTLREDAYQQSRPTLQEGSTVALTAAVTAGGTAFVMAVFTRRRQGKRLKEFTGQDWLDIAGETGLGAGKGGVRGLSIYTLTNFTTTSAAVASSIVTASFSIAEQANKLRRNEIDELEFIETSELIALEAAVRALSSFIGQAAIPVPVLGAVIGNTVGIVMYKAVASSLTKREAALIERYLEEQRALDEQLDTEYRALLDKLDQSMSDYLGLLERAFSPDVEVAFVGSVALAAALGVVAEEILDSAEKVEAYFLD
ncbi:hypothetical protein NN3_29080 [Nocardia neocaledoniensis NBRC 108232]|uniref:Uncharacterized protein n=2 Tax=Nocardia neocaledoniensis TaxID=236511 RepID=A0A317N4I8_9NOCA|nr:hypothetical protein [Nocardia neocaledoniensis]PWV70205.1 hypothetical protein DFR69_114172 [Nocardia neocaledoniensis]GEM31901.1 hypothetical protein NN3_29080 [Nocardia neocaledoniensis NBRC 108232]